MKRASSRSREIFARATVAAAGVTDPRIERVFADVAREDYAGPGPWLIARGGGYAQTPDDDPAHLYCDDLVAIDAARGINIGQPSLHARCLAELRLEPGETVLHVGAGVGYYTAMLARLVGGDGRVFAYEIDPGIAARAKSNLARAANVVVEARSGVASGLPAADAIYVNAAATQPYAAWRDALKPGGRLLFPLEAPGARGAMLLIERPRQGERWPARFLFPVAFIACEAEHDRAAERRLAARLADESWREVRTLRFDAPDDSCWFSGAGWWLSRDA